jgi:hypothetical protein
MTPVPVTRPPRTLPAVESGTRESALCTIANVGTALESLREVRKHVQATYAITDDEARAFIRNCRSR